MLDAFGVELAKAAPLNSKYANAERTLREGHEKGLHTGDPSPHCVTCRTEGRAAGRAKMGASARTFLAGIRKEDDCGVNTILVKSNRRSAGSAALGASALGAGGYARGRRREGAHLRELSQTFRDASRKDMAVSQQRVVRHVQGSLPRTRANLTRTAKVMHSAASKERGASDAARDAFLAARKAKGAAGAAALLGAGSVALAAKHKPREQFGSYSYR